MKHLIVDIISEGQELINGQLAYIQEKVLPLSDDDLSWKPNKDKWNILEVVEHLNRFGDFYLPRFDNMIVYPKSRRNGAYYRSGFLGEFAMKRIRPVDGVVPYKSKAIGKASPFLRKLDRRVVEEHVRKQMKFRKILKEVQELNLSRNSIPTLFAPWLKFNIGDTLRIYGYHQERHFVQIDNLLNKRPD